MRWNNHPLISFICSHIIKYPTPVNLNYMWSFGSAAGICLVIQIISGVFLAMFYTPHVDYAFISVEYIMRDVQNGWLLRYLHSNGASIFFIVVYCHIFRGLYYGSYTKPRGSLWISGVVIFFLMMATAFIGYVLPWGQMSFWGVTVITSMFSAIPFVGKSIVEWLWGGFSISNATLNRFFSFHYIFPFLIAGATLVHLSLLHEEGSNNPIGTPSVTYKIPFYPYFYVKDLLAFFVLIWLFSFLIFYYPNLLGHPDNYIPAYSLKTPDHVVPEWYFLPFYAILRAIPHKIGGIIAMGAAIAGLAVLPFIHFSKIRSGTFRLVYQLVFFGLLGNFLVLIWIGAKSTEPWLPYLVASQYLTFSYFLLLFIGIPVSGMIDSYLATFRLLKNFHGRD